MAFLSAKEWQFGRQNVFATDVGASDLPSTNTSGVIQVGDWTLNLSGTVGSPAYWVCTAQSSSSVAWNEGSLVGGGNQIRTVTASTTLLSSDHYLFITAAGTITLPAPNSTLGTHQYEIKAFGATAQPVTITAASGGNLDSVTLGSQTLTANESASYFTDGLTNWLSVGRDPLQQSRTIASNPSTLSFTDKFVLSPAGAVTLPVTSLMAIGQEIIVHATASSVTLTPTAGNYNGATAGTLTSNQVARIWTDGTNWYTAS